MAVVKKPAVTINFRISPFVEHPGNAIAIQGRGEICPFGVLHAMHGPEGLGQAVQGDLVENFFPRMEENYDFRV